MSIRFKLISSISVLSAAILIITASAFSSINTVTERTRSLLEDRVVPMAGLKKVADMFAVDIVDSTHKIGDGSLPWATGSANISKALATVDKEWNAYSTTAMTTREKGMADEFEKQRTNSASALRRLSEILAKGDQEALHAFAATELYPAIDPLSKPINDLINLQMEVAQSEYVETVAERSSILLWMSCLSVLAFAVVCFSIAVVIGGVSRPLSALGCIMQRIASGDLDVTLEGENRKDEIGGMVCSLAIFQKAAITNRQLEADAAIAREKAEADRLRLTEEANTAAQMRLDAATSGLAAGLQRLAAGDLAFQITEPFSPDFEALRHNLNSAASQLNTTMLAVQQASSYIETGSQDISQGAQDLSRRTEQQAAALEETAAALDQITASVSNSAQRTGEARRLTEEANRNAKQSGSVVANAVNAMERIQQSSAKISNIIGVIDEIAFQTNLLALNAGVEAARAGEAGKGFAVVAQEVRELAQRSAQAAKEIKDLIRNSTNEVNTGVELVSETGEALRSIETKIEQINRHVDAIATSSREQSTGMSEVNVAVNQMDQVTQQNAAMVEETSAASATLASEALRMKALVGQFKLGHAERHSFSRMAA